MLGNWNTRREDRIGVMLHYDASSSDRGAVEWLTRNPKCKVSYNWLVTDEGAIHSVAPYEARAWHAGACRPSSTKLKYKDANSAFFGIAIAARDGEVATHEQFTSVVRLTMALFKAQGWTDADIYRITSHHLEAWPRGRKQDIIGPDPENPVLCLDTVRDEVAARLRK